MTLTATQLEALPVHDAVLCTTERGRPFVALKIDQGTGRHNPSRWNTSDGPATTVQIAAHNPVHLVAAHPAQVVSDTRREDVVRALALVDSLVDPPMSGRYGRYADAVLAALPALPVVDGGATRD